MSESLEHFGVKGMHWGSRRDPELAGIKSGTKREAARDAKESARAKMYYGQGAGTRRKLINATVAQKSKQDPEYKKAYDAFTNRQNMADHALKARQERRRTDTTTGVVKTAKGVHRQLTGGFGTVSLAAATIASAYVAANRAGVDKIVVNAAKTTVKTIANEKTRRILSEQFLRKVGLK